MIYFAILIIIILNYVIFNLIRNCKRSKLQFQNRIQYLEHYVEELNQNLKFQNQKVKLSEDLKMKYKMSNQELSESIFQINLDLFESLYSKK